MIKRYIYFFLLLLFITDLSYSFVQHLNQPLDGDMSGGLILSKDVAPILESPLGFKAIKEDITYANPNRFFCHWSFREYMLSAPLILQKFTKPIESVYLASAIFKIVIQLILILLLAIIITGNTNFFKLDFMVAVILVTPFFQGNGYQNMCIIDKSTTYVFFYALPCIFLLLYFIPFINRFFHGISSPISLAVKVFWIPLAIVVSLSGPLNTGVVLVFCSLIIISYLIRTYVNSNKVGMFRKILHSIINIPKAYWFFLLPVGLLSLYSLFLGRYNSITIENEISLLEIYSKLPVGVFQQFTQKLGFPILFLVLIINTILIDKYYKTAKGKKIISIFKWIGVFSLCYILLLPLGGYRPYRPNVLRYDTIIPITLSLMFIYGISTLYLIKNISKRQKKWYFPVIVAVLIIFTNADNLGFEKNDCEKSALYELSESKDLIVPLPYDCTILEWDIFSDPKKSEPHGILLQKWNITKEKKLFYNK